MYFFISLRFVYFFGGIFCNIFLATWIFAMIQFAGKFSFWNSQTFFTHKNFLLVFGRLATAQFNGLHKICLGIPKSIKRPPILPLPLPRPHMKYITKMNAHNCSILTVICFGLWDPDGAVPGGGNFAWNVFTSLAVASNARLFLRGDTWFVFLKRFLWISDFFFDLIFEFFLRIS